MVKSILRSGAFVQSQTLYLPHHHHIIVHPMVYC